MPACYRRNSRKSNVLHNDVDFDCDGMLHLSYSASAVVCYDCVLTVQETRMMAGDRFLGFDAGDWTMLLSGFAVAGC